MLLLLLLIQCKISLYLGPVRTVRPVRPVRCFVTPGWIVLESGLNYIIIASGPQISVRILYPGPQSWSADFWSAYYTFTGPQVRRSAVRILYLAWNSGRLI